MKQQLSFGYIEYSNRRRKTKREQFLISMDAIIPWKHWIAMIQPYYYTNTRGRKAKDIEIMLRMYLMQNWFNLSDEGIEEAIYDSYAMRRFLGINFSEEPEPVPYLVCQRRSIIIHSCGTNSRLLQGVVCPFSRKIREMGRKKDKMLLKIVKNE